MPSPRVLCLFLLSACATTGTLASDRDASSHARVQLAPLVGDETVRLTPHAVEPLLPSVDRIAHTVDAQLGPEASVDVEYCVSPSGKVVAAELTRGSNLVAFDAAVLTDIGHWQFDAQPGPEHLRTCERATIVYRARR